MPDITRIDSHQHFWALGRGDYPWPTVDLPQLYRDFLPADLQVHLTQAEIDKTIVVQAAPTLDETHYLLQLAEQNLFIAGVVGWVDMESPMACRDIESLAEHSYFLGIRPMIQAIADPGWILKPELSPVYEKLAGLGLTFDALVTPQHLPNLYTLLLRHPDLKLVIDHGAKPDIKNGRFQPWATDIQRIAENTRAYCKLSGLLTEAGNEVSYEKLRPYMQHLLECFGAERLIWGSDWPVLELAADYQTWKEMTEQFLSALSTEDRSRILGGNAQAFYGF